MRSKAMFLFFTVIMFVLCGCATKAKYRVEMNHWIGKNINQFTRVYGSPEKTIKAPSGNKVYVYRTKTTDHFPASKLPTYTIVNNQGNAVIVEKPPNYIAGSGEKYVAECTTWVEFNHKEIITGIVFRGNNCVAK